MYLYLALGDSEKKRKDPILSSLIIEHQNLKVVESSPKLWAFLYCYNLEDSHIKLQDPVSWSQDIRKTNFDLLGFFFVTFYEVLHPFTPWDIAADLSKREFQRVGPI